MKWYFVKDGSQVGPFSQAGFLEHVERGEIKKDTLVWNQDMLDWCAYKDLPDTIGEKLLQDEQSPDAKCSMCGKPFGADEMISFEGKQVCANCKGTFVQQIRENSDIKTRVSMEYAGFWRRFVAVFIDSIIMNVVTIPGNLGFQYFMVHVDEGALFGVLAALCYILMVFVPALYWILMHGKFGATVGKKAMGIRVIMADGSRMTWGRTIGRYFSTMLSSILCIGYIMAGFDEEKRALHDRICNTRVIRV
ncbi:MAG: RDD family protein [Pontiellaceae bacterium]|nr:RDD family protein [Pontiellaceae bacterium]MBN2786003.1 RDD family protein [Pontiellaceae bacterium]